MAMNDAICFMMSQQLLKAVKRLSSLEKSCASCLQMAKAVKVSTVGKCTTYLKLVWKPKVLRFDKILVSLPLYRIPNFPSLWSDRTQIMEFFLCKTDFPFPFQMTRVDVRREVDVFLLQRFGHKAKLLFRL